MNKRKTRSKKKYKKYKKNKTRKALSGGMVGWAWNQNKQECLSNKESTIEQIVKRIIIPGETKESALKRAKNLQEAAPAFEPDKWNSPDEKRNPHNCYTYFLDKQDKNLTAKCKAIKCKPRNALKPQPGYYAGYPRIKNKKRYNCGILVKRILADNPNLIYKKGDMRCDKGYYSGALTVHPKLTYHFYRQDSVYYVVTKLILYITYYRIIYLHYSLIC